MNISVLQAPPTTGLTWTSVAASEKEAEFLSFKLLNKRARIRLSPQPLDLSALDGKGTYFIVANLKGWLVAVARNNEGQSSLVFSPLNELRKAIASSTSEGEENFEPKRNLPLTSVPCHLALVLNEDRLAVGFGDGSIAIYDTASLFIPGSNAVAPLHIFPAGGPGPLRQILGNPADLPDLLAVRREASNGADGLAVEIIDARQLKSIGGWRATGGIIPTSINWSTKGKQLAIGLQNGDIVTFSPTITGSPKLHVPKPACVGDSSIVTVMWLSNTNFYGIYTPSGRTDPEAPQKHVSIHYDPKATSASQTELETPYFASPALRPPGAFTVVMRNWDPLKTMVIVADSTSSDIGIVANISEDAAAEQWSNLTLEETSTPSVPLDKEADDTVPLGLEADLTAESENDKVSAPILYVYASDGTVQAWSISNSKAGPYPGMIVPSAQAKATLTSAPPISGADASSPAVGTAFSQPQPAFGSPAPSASGSAFGKPPVPAFGSPGFSSFAQSQNQTPKIEPSTPQTTSAFGQATKSPAFGQTSTFGQATSTPAFGQASGISSLGSPFGQSGFGQRPASGFGAFASQGPSKFGQSGFGFATPPPTSQAMSTTPVTPATPAVPTATMVPATPARTTPPDTSTVDSPEAEMSDADIGDDDTFGGLSLGGSKPANKADSGAVNSMFGAQTPTPAPKTTSAFASGGSSFGSSQGAFGAFGNVQGNSFLKPASGFGVFSKAADPTQPKSTSESVTAAKPTPSSAFGSSGFGKAGTGQPAFGQSAFGQPSFGAPSQFGKPSEFGKPSGFGTAPASAVGTSGPNAFSAYAGGSKGFGSFAQGGVSAFGQVKASQPNSTDTASSASTEEAKSASATEPSQKPSSVFASAPASSSDTKTSVFGNASKPSIFGSQTGSSVFGGTGEAKSSFGVASGTSNIFGGAQFLSPGAQKQEPSPTISTTPQSSPLTTDKPAATDNGTTTPTPARFKSGPSSAFSVFANLPPTPPRPKAKAKDETAEDEGEEEGEEDGEEEDGGGDGIEDFLSDSQSDDAEQSESDEDAEDEENATADEESDDDGEVIDSTEGLEGTEKSAPATTDGENKDVSTTPQGKAADATNAAATASTTPAKTPPPVFGRPPLFGGSNLSTPAQPASPLKSPPPGPSDKSAAGEPEIKASATGKSPSPSPSPFGQKTGSPANAGSATPAGSPDKDGVVPGVQAPKPVSAAQALPSSALGRQDTRPARSSPLAGSPVSGLSAESKSTGDTPGTGTLKPRPASPKTPFGMTPPSAPKSEGTTPILPTAFGMPRQQSAPSPFNPQSGILPSPSPPSLPSPKPPVFKTPSLPATGVSGNAPFIMPSTTPSGTPSLPFSLTSQPTQPSVPAPATSKPSGLPPVPQITRSQEQVSFVSSMQKECHTLCAAMAEEFEQLQKLSHAAAMTRNTLGRPSSAAHTRDDLKDRTKWSFGDLEAFSKLIKGIEKDVLAVYEANKELVPVMREIESNLLKAETRKEEIARFSKAKADPDFAKMLKARTLGPEAAETQAQLRKQIRMMENRVEQLESYLKAAKKRLDEHQRGKKAIRPPSLDTINRTYRNIDLAIKFQTEHIDELAARVSKLKINDLDSALRCSQSSFGRGSAELSVSRHRQISEGDDDRQRIPASPSIAASTAAALNAERNALRLKTALFKARKEPLLNTQAVEAASNVPTLDSARKAGGSQGGWKPGLGSLDLAGEYIHDVEHQRRTRNSKHDKPVKLGRTHQRVPSDIKTFDWGPLPGAKPLTTLPADVLNHKPT